MLEVYLSIQLLHQSNVSRYWVHSEVLLGAGVKCKAVSHLLAFGVCPVEGIDVCACGEKSGSYRMHITSCVAGELFTQRLSQQAHLVEFKKWFITTSSSTSTKHTWTICHFMWLIAHWTGQRDIEMLLSKGTSCELRYVSTATSGSSC